MQWMDGTGCMRPCSAALPRHACRAGELGWGLGRGPPDSAMMGTPEVQQWPCSGWPSPPVTEPLSWCDRCLDWRDSFNVAGRCLLRFQQPKLEALLLCGVTVHMNIDARVAPQSPQEQPNHDYSCLGQASISKHQSHDLPISWQGGKSNLASRKYITGSNPRPEDR